MNNFNLVRGLYTSAFIVLLVISNVSAQWSTKGPYGGSVSAITVSDTTVFVASPSGGVYKSTNSTASAWQYVNYTGMSSGKITSLSSIGRVIVAGSEDKGIFLSRNNGTTWETGNAGLGILNISALTVSQGKIFAGTNGAGVFMSSDSGLTWTFANIGLSSLTITALTSSAGALLAGTFDGGIFISSDNGNSWVEANSGLLNLHVNTIAVSALTIFAGTNDGVFTASAISPVWSLTTSGMITTAVNALLANGSLLFAGTDAGIFSSSDSGLNWVSEGISTDTVTAFGKLGTSVFAGTTGNGIYSSTNSNSGFAIRNSGFNAIETFAIAASDTTVVTSTANGVFVCSNFPSAPVYVRSNTGLSDSLHVTCVAIANGKLFAGTLNAGFFFSLNKGLTWTQWNNGLTSLNCVRLYATGTSLALATGDGKVYSKAQVGLTWFDNSAGLPDSVQITSFAGSVEQLFLGCEVGVFVNTGSEWSSAALSEPVNALAVLNDNIYASSIGEGVLRSSIDQFNWEAVNAGLPENQVTSLGVTGNYVVAGYKGGVHATYNAGAEWLAPDILQYIPEYGVVKDIAFTEARVFVFTPENSVYSSSKGELPQDTSVVTATHQQTDNADVTIYPNPSSGSFRFDAGNESESGALVISDLLGRVVFEKKMIYNQEHIILDQPAGIYLLNYYAAQKKVTRKLLITN